MKNIYIILLVSLFVSGLSYLAYYIYSDSQKEKNERTFIENNEYDKKKKIRKTTCCFFMRTGVIIVRNLNQYGKMLRKIPIFNNSI